MIFINLFYFFEWRERDMVDNPEFFNFDLEKWCGIKNVT